MNDIEYFIFYAELYVEKLDMGIDDNEDKEKFIELYKNYRKAIKKEFGEDSLISLIKHHEVRSLPPLRGASHS